MIRGNKNNGGITMTIRKVAGTTKYRVYSTTSHRNLGTYRTKAGAMQRETQVNFFKTLAKHPELRKKLQKYR